MGFYVIRVAAGRKVVLIFLTFLILFFLTASFRDSVQMPDEEYVIRVATALALRQPLNLQKDVPYGLYPASALAGRDGNVYSVYPIGPSLLYAPAVFLIRGILSFTEPYHPREFGTPKNYEVWIERQVRRHLQAVPIVLSALSCAVFFLFAWRMGFSESTAVLLTFLYGLGTMVWPYSKYLLAESAQNLLLLLTVFALFAQRLAGRIDPRTMVLSGASFGLLLCMRTSFIVIAPILAAYWAWGNRDRRLIAPLVLFAIPMFILMVPQFVYDFIRFGDALDTGYGREGFKTPLWVGLYGYALSTGKSFFLYAPASVLFFAGIRRFYRRARHEALLICALAVAISLKFAGWWLWSGDPCWGPRFLLPLTPFLLLPVGEVIERAVSDRGWLRRSAVGAVAAASVVVQVMAVSVHYLYYLDYVHRAAPLFPPCSIAACEEKGVRDVPVRDRFLDVAFVPEYSPILGQWWMMRSLLSGRNKPADTVPWAGLGYWRLHEGVELKAAWDFWFISMFRDGITVKVIKGLLAFAGLLVVLAILLQELLYSALRPRPEDRGR